MPEHTPKQRTEKLIINISTLLALFRQALSPFAWQPYSFHIQIVNWDDPSWWQARKVNSKERPGLIPSQDLEERRQCFVQGSGLVTTQASCFSCGTGVSDRNGTLDTL